MFLSAIILALIVGALAGGGLPRLANLKLRWIGFLGAALALRLAAGFSREFDVTAGIPVGWAYIGAYLLIFIFLWGNWRVPGLQIASVGIAANTLAVVLHGGQMPILSSAFSMAGFTAADIANDPFHFILRADSVAAFVAAGGLLGDVIPIPIPVIRDVVSIGDMILALGLFWAIVYSMTRLEAPSRAALAVGAAPARGAPIGPFQAGVAYAGAGTIPAEAGAVAVRGQSPYLRLAGNRNFGLLWVGQLVSLFGERIHVIALAFIVSEATGGSALEIGFTFAATAIPNVVLGPLAGALVDRWDRRRTMIGCDLVRAVLVLTVPFVVEINIGLVYVLAFLIATVTLLFRPAKTAVIPVIVDRRDLVTANSASTVADTAADLLGLPLAGIVVATLTGALEFAFYLDAVTYVVSAVLIWAMALPKDETEEGASVPMTVRAVWREMVEGWNFLRRQAELFSNTLVSTVAQLAVGAEIVASVPYAQRVLDTSTMAAGQIYALLLTGIAVGSVLGGVVIGAMGERLPKGPMIIAGFIGMGLSLVAAGLVTNPYLAIGIFAVTGFANMLFIIPTITLFQERTPQRLMGRVVSSRQALVFGAIAASMAISGFAADAIGPALVLIISGGICAAAGAVGLLVPAMRDAR